MPTQTNLVTPSKVNTLGILNIISGVLNALAACGLTISVVVGSFGLGLICAPLTLLPALLGVFEILYGVKLLSNPPQPVQPSKALAIVQIASILYLNIITVLVGVLALVFYGDEEVRDYFERINASQIGKRNA